MLWGQRIKVYTEHKNLVRDALGLTCDRIYLWRLLLEEYGPKIVYIKGTHNIAIDTINRFEYEESINTYNMSIHVRNMVLAKLFNGYARKITNSNIFQTNNVCVPIGTRMFLNHLKSANANYSTMNDMSHDDRERSAIVAVINNSVKKHPKCLFANISKTDEDEIYLLTVSEIADSQRRHRLYKNHF